MKPPPTPPKRAAKPQPPPSVRPHRCVLLAIDAGAEGGWAIFVAGKLVQFGQVKGFDLDAVQTVVRAAMQLSEIAHLPIVLVIEKPATYRRSGARSFSTTLGMGAARGVWRAAWLSAGLGARRMIDAPIATWRARVLGGGASRLKREQVRPIEQAAARAYVSAELGESKAALVGPDSAPAIHIGRWGCHAAQVAARLPASARAA